MYICINIICIHCDIRALWWLLAPTGSAGNRVTCNIKNDIYQKKKKKMFVQLYQHDHDINTRHRNRYEIIRKLRDEKIHVETVYVCKLNKISIFLCIFVHSQIDLQTSSLSGPLSFSFSHTASFISVFRYYIIKT